jgi:hypothetical protein
MQVWKRAKALHVEAVFDEPARCLREEERPAKEHKGDDSLHNVSPRQEISFGMAKNPRACPGASSRCRMGTAVDNIPTAKPQIERSTTRVAMLGAKICMKAEIKQMTAPMRTALRRSRMSQTYAAPMAERRADRLQ